MKLVNWTDRRGFKYRSILPDNSDENMAPHGVPAGPPNLDQLDWDAIKHEINDGLYRNGLSVLKLGFVDLQR